MIAREPSVRAPRRDDTDVEERPAELPGLCNELAFMCKSCGHSADGHVSYDQACPKCRTANWERVPQRMVQRFGDRRRELPGSPRRAGPRTKEYRESEHTPGPPRVRRLVLPHRSWSSSF